MCCSFWCCNLLVRMWGALCHSRGDETIIKSIMVLTSPLGACMLSARQTKQTDATIRQTDHIASVLAISEGSCWLVLCGSFELAAFRSPTSCFSWVPSCVMTVFVLFILIVNSFIDSYSFLVTLSVFAGLSASLLEAIWSSFLWFLVFG